MIVPRLIRSIPAFCAAALLAGCVASPVAPGALSGVSQSWIDPAAKSGALLYVGQLNNGTISIYSFPKGAYVGQLTGVQPNGLCSDSKSGDIFVPFSNEVLVYKHGGTSPIATLTDAYGMAFACSVDASTGNLAVTNLSGPTSSPGNVVIYAKEKGSGKKYSSSGMRSFFFCGYDGSGNLFIDGEQSSGGFTFAELPSGGKSLTTITLNQSITFPAGVQWDGKYVAVSDQEASNIYRFTISGSTGKLEGTSSFKGWGDVTQFWIQGSDVIGPDEANYDIGIWAYPKGGKAHKLITKNIYGPQGVTVST